MSYENMRIKIHGSLWVNCAKYEDVDEIIVWRDDVEIMKDNKSIGCILRENIETLVEQNYDLGIMTDLLENMSYIIDITRPGDDGRGKEHWD